MGGGGMYVCVLGEVGWVVKGREVWVRKDCSESE